MVQLASSQACGGDGEFAVLALSHGECGKDTRVLVCDLGPRHVCRVVGCDPGVRVLAPMQERVWQGFRLGLVEIRWRRRSTIATDVDFVKINTRLNMFFNSEYIYSP